MPPPPDPSANDTIGKVVRRWAEVQPDAPIFIEDGKMPLSYRGMLEVMDGMAFALGEAGLGRGSRIAIIAPSGADLASAIIGICSVATAVLVNPGFTADEFAAHFQDCRVDALVIEKEMDTVARAVAVDNADQAANLEHALVEETVDDR